MEHIHSLEGLSAGQAEKSRNQHGANELSQKKQKNFFLQYLSSFGDPIIQILLGALVLNVLFLFRNSNWMEAAGIAAAVFLSTFVSTLSEYGSETAFSKLMAEADAICCRVKRKEGIISLPISQIVVGDLILLQAGEKIPADGYLVQGSLRVDQSALNGESAEVEKKTVSSSFHEPAPQEWDLTCREHLFRGSVVNAGDGIMRVANVGDSTFYGCMAREMQDETRDSPLKVKLSHLARTISRLGYIAAGLIAAADLFHSICFPDGQVVFPIIALTLPDLYTLTGYILHALTLAITIVVVAVPEGLPMMITVVLSSNMLRMLSDHVMVRKLVGIETAGSLSILFTDKTGTLTAGKLAVNSFVEGNGRRLKFPDGALKKLLTLSGFFNTASVLSEDHPLGGNPTDRAMMEYAFSHMNKQELEELDKYETLSVLPFSSTRKYSAASIGSTEKETSMKVENTQQGEDQKEHRDEYLTLIKGAPEILLAACARRCTAAGEQQAFSGADRRAVERVWHEMTGNAVRVIALAFSSTAKAEELADHPEKLSDLTLIGLCGISDNLRPEAAAAVQEVQGAGVQVVMVTGDNQDTAAAIAKGCGLSGRVITGTQMASLSDKELAGILPELSVVARTLPTDKSRLVRIAQEQNMVVGMTGDGINDAPALKKADVGFAMGDGTEVAKEAGDIVILDNNIASIAKAILYGRTIFKSIRKFIVFQLTINLCAVGVSLIGPFVGMDTPITIIQMLWVNIIMDTLAGLAFAGEPPLPEYMKEKPKQRDESVLTRSMVEQILFMGCFMISMCLFFMISPAIKSFYHADYTPSCYLTAFFTLFIFSGIAGSFNARTHRLNLLSHLKKNPAFIGIMSLVSIVQLLLIYYGGNLFRTGGLSPRELLATLALASLVIPADLLRKVWIRSRGRDGSF